MAVLAVSGWVVYDRSAFWSSCTIALDPRPGLLAAFAGGENSGNIELPDGLGHFRTFPEERRFPSAGAPLASELDPSFRDGTSGHGGTVCTDFIHDDTHYATMCQRPDQIAEVQRDVITASLLIVDGDTVMEVFLSEDAGVSADMETSTCSMARAVRALNADYLASE